MKHFLVLLALVILAVSQLEAKLTHLTVGNEYEYDYYGHYLATIAKNGNRQVGMGIKGKVIMTVTASDKCIFKLQQIKTAKLNEDLDDVDEDDISWQFQDAQGSLAVYLHKPIRVYWNNGKVQSLETDPEEPDESLNIKKAILSLYQLNTERLLSPLAYDSSSSLMSKLSMSSSYKRNLLNSRYGNVINDTHVFETVEGGINGECVSHYVVESDPYPANPQSDCLNVTKFRDLDNCADRPLWARSTHVPVRCTNCEADDENPFTTITKIEYNIEKRGSELIIESIEAEAQTVFAPLTTDSDYFLANHSQILILQNVRQMSTAAAIPLNAKSSSSLTYVFPTVKRALQSGVQDLKKRQVPFLSDRRLNVVPQAVKLFKELAREIVSEASNEKYTEDTPLKVYKLVTNIRLMDKDQVVQFYSEACSSDGQSTPASPKDIKQICVDILVMSGCNPAILFVKYLIESKKITGEMAVQAVQAMPTNIFEPTYDIISEILALAKSPAAQENRQLHKTAWLTFAILVSQACDGPENDLPNLPDAPHLTDYCPQEVERKYIQELADKLRNSQRRGDTMLFLRALGLTEVPTAIEAIRPFAQGDASEDDYVQRCALHSLKIIAKFAPEEVMDIAEDEFYDTDNPNSVRIAALRAMFTSQPDFSDLQRIVAWSQKEPSDDVKGYIYSFFDSISNATHFCLKDLANDADQLMANLDEDDENGIQASNVWETSEIFEELGMSTQTFCSWTASNSSIVPETIMCRVNNSIGGVSYKPIAFSINMKGIGPIINRIIGPSASFSKIKSIEDLFRPESELQDKKRTNINDQLKLDTREQETFELSAFMIVGDTQARMMHLDHKTIIDYIKSGMSHGISMSDLHSGIPIHYHKLTLLYELQLQTPSILGVPIVLNVLTPGIFSVKGQIAARVDATATNPNSILPGNIQIEADIRPSFSCAKRVALGVYNPFEKEVASAVLLTTTYVAPPLSLIANINLLQGKVKLDVKPSTSAYQASSEAPKVFHYKVKPYSMHCSLVKLDEICSQNIKVIHSSEPNIKEIDLSEKLLGWPLLLKSKSEHDWDDRGSFVDWFMNYESVVTFLNTWWATPDFSARNYDVYLQGRSAQGKEIELTAEWEYTPTPIQSIIFGSKHSAKGFWPLLSGFSYLPQRCGGKGSQNYDADLSPTWYLEYGSRRTSSKKMLNMDDTTYNDSFDNDEDYDDDLLRPYYESHRNRTSKGMSPSYYTSSATDSPWSFRKESGIWKSGDSQRSERMPYSTQMRSRAGGISVQKVSRSNQVSVLSVQLKAVAKGASTKLASHFTLKRNRDTLTDVVSLTIDAINIPAFSFPNLQMCTTASIKYPDVPCDYHSLMSTRAAQPIQANVKVSWGAQTCTPTDHISVKAIFDKSKEQVLAESQKTEWYFDQCQRDISQGKKLTEACEIAQLEFSSLNKMTLDVEYTPLPPFLRNLTSWADNLLKAKYYLQMSNNPVDVHNGDGRLKVVAVLRDEVQSLDLKLFKPKENTFFKKIYIADDVPYVYPISTQQSILKQLYDDVTNGMATPSCKVMGKHINTYDNTTYKYPLPAGCEHVITKDCSPEDLFAVTMSSIGSGLKRLNVYVLSHQITVEPQERYSGKFTITADGRPVEPSDEDVIIIKSEDEDAGGKVVAVLVITGPTVHVLAPMHGVKTEFDGEDAKVTLSGLWSNRVCGLCGQFDGESDEDDLIGPQQCIYPDPVSFALSYALSGPQCNLPSPPNPNKMCDSDTPYPQPRSGGFRHYQRGNDDDDDVNDGMYIIKPRSRTDDMRTTYTHKRRDMGDM